MKLRIRTLWLLAGWALIFAVFYLSLAPISIDIGGKQGDKFLHVLAYATLMFWFAHAYEQSARRRRLAAAFVAMGIAIEFLQRETGYRTFEVADMIAGAIGVATARIGVRVSILFGPGRTDRPSTRARRRAGKPVSAFRKAPFGVRVSILSEIRRSARQLGERRA